MNKRFLIVTVLSFILSGFILSFSANAERPARAIEQANSLSEAFEYVADTVTPSLVNITGVKKISSFTSGIFAVP